MAWGMYKSNFGTLANVEAFSYFCACWHKSIGWYGWIGLRYIWDILWMYVRFNVWKAFKQRSQTRHLDGYIVVRRRRRTCSGCIILVSRFSQPFTRCQTPPLRLCKLTANMIKVVMSDNGRNEGISLILYKLEYSVNIPALMFILY